MRRKENLSQWAAQTDGCYLLWTNRKGKSAQELWKTYIGRTQIEDSFRISKHDLGLRPINKPKRISNVVQTFAQKNGKIE